MVSCFPPTLFPIVMIVFMNLQREVKTTFHQWLGQFHSTRIHFLVTTFVFDVFSASFQSVVRMSGKLISQSIEACGSRIMISRKLYHAKNMRLPGPSGKPIFFSFHPFHNCVGGMMQFPSNARDEGGKRILLEKFMAMRIWECGPSDGWWVVTAPLHVDVNLLPHIAVALLIFPFHSLKTRNFSHPLQLTLLCSLAWYWGRKHHLTFIEKIKILRARWRQMEMTQIFNGEKKKKHPMDVENSMGSLRFQVIVKNTWGNE